MDVQFFQIFASSLEAKADYIKDKLAHSPASLPRAEHWAAAIDALNEEPVVEQRSNWPALTPEQDAYVRDRIACGTAMADRFLPRADGEVVESDAFSYLTQSWGHAPAGTPVLRRATNQAVVYCFFDEFVVAAGDAQPLRLVRGGDAEPEPGQVSIAAIEPLGFGFEEIALELAKALLEKLASLAIEGVMGSSVPAYFGEVYAELRKIVAQELDAHMIRELTDKFTAAQEWNNGHYLTLKRAVPPTPVSELERQMNDEQVAFYTHLSLLKDPAVDQVALGEFMIGSSMQLAFLQELLNVTGASHWKEELNIRIDICANSVEATWKKVTQARAAKIKVQSDGDCTPVNGATKCNYYYTSYDYVAGTWGSKFYYNASDTPSENKAKARAENEAAARRLAAIDQLRTALGKPEETVAKWRSLK